MPHTVALSAELLNNVGECVCDLKQVSMISSLVNLAMECSGDCSREVQSRNVAWNCNSDNIRVLNKIILR